MKKNLYFLMLMTAILPLHSQKILSPSNKLSLEFSINNQGVPAYTLKLGTKLVAARSELGINLKDKGSLTSDFELIGSTNSSFDQTWKPVLGEVSKIRNNYNELTVSLRQRTTGIKMNIVFRMFDDGVGFRYEFPQQEKLNYFVVTSEKTQFAMEGDHKAFWIPGDFDSQEYEYNETRLSGIDVDKVDLNNGVGFKGPLAKTRVQSPIMIKTAEKLYISIFEAAVVNYPVMHLNLNSETLTFTSALAPNPMGDAAYLQAPCELPWRTILVSDDARDILSSKTILNLNESSVITDVSWIKPMKYVGIWWEMHVGKSTWDYAGSQNAQTSASEQKPTGKHGATTENAKRYIDFAAKHGFDGVLIEGWNKGWEDWFGNWKEEVFDFVSPYPDFDVKTVSEYARAKKVKLIMHHETSGSVTNYERRLDRAFDFMKNYGYDAVKTGYVGRIIPRGEFHDGQTMVKHFNYVVERAAERKILVNSHESSRPTGLHRTYPNYIAAEAARGNEFNAWSNGNQPMHETILPFTRLLGGPMDYTPGIFEIKMSHYDPSKNEQVHTTLAKQLALYVTMYSPLQMAADLPENYEKYPDAFQFIKNVAADWDDTQILEAEPGDYITIARKAKGTSDWYLGAITDENARSAKLSLKFLGTGKKYKATIYQDAKDAHWQKNPQAYKITEQIVDSKSVISLSLAPGGGTAISIVEIK